MIHAIETLHQLIEDGVGFFGIELADVVESFVGVEYDRLAIQAAQVGWSDQEIVSQVDWLDDPAREVVVMLQNLQQANAINNARSTTDADDQSSF
mgnify:CR=1 FL=1